MTVGPVRTEVFTFGTRLTRVTRELSHRDPDAAMAAVSCAIPDYSGGTRIGELLKAFLDAHGQRGMARGAVAVVLSDGWERGDPELLGAQMARLARWPTGWSGPTRARRGPGTPRWRAAWPRRCRTWTTSSRATAWRPWNGSPRWWRATWTRASGPCRRCAVRDILPDLRRWSAAGTPVALATVVGVSQSAPRQPGASMAVIGDGTVLGSVSGGCVEGAVYETAQRCWLPASPSSCATASATRTPSPWA